MECSYYFKKIPQSRIATFDVYAIGLRRHHIGALLEFDVTEARSRLRELRKKDIKISFNAWILKVIGEMLKKHPEAAAFLNSKKKLIIFSNIDVSMMVEKTVNGKKVPIPLLIREIHLKSATEITREIEGAREKELTGRDIVIHDKPAFFERMYFHLPGPVRRLVLKLLIGNPGMAFSRMGNVVVTSVGMMGKINGWFIHKSVHPISFGIGSVLKKPVVVGDEIKIREILNMTILIDHDVIDGAPMVRMLNDFTKALEEGAYMEI